MQGHMIEFISELPFNPYDGTEDVLYFYVIDFDNKIIELRGPDENVESITKNVEYFNSWSEKKNKKWKSVLNLDLY